jgi:hypothetical protein
VQWLRRLWRQIRLPLREPTKFQDLAATKARLARASDAQSMELLQEASEIFDALLSRAEGVERRATSLLATVGIAASLSLASASLLLGPARIQCDWWRRTITLVALGVVVSLVMSGLRSAQVLRIHRWTVPRDEDILGRVEASQNRARLDRAVSLLAAAGANEPVVEWKVAHLRAAVWWFFVSLAWLVALVVVLLAYAAFPPN